MSDSVTSWTVAMFYKYGAIRDIDLKNRRGGPPFAFVEFEDPR